MTLQDYLNHYFETSNLLVNFAIAVAMVLIFSVIIILVARLMSSVKASKRGSASGEMTSRFREDNYRRAHNYLERFYEMLFSATSILLFLSAYYLVDRFVTDAAFRIFWDEYKDFILLILIVFSCIINNLLDHIFIRLKNLDKSDKASIRLMGMFYVLFVFAYIKYIYENDNYDRFILYFCGLVIGRFVYFDASLKDFWNTFRNGLLNFPVLVMGLACTGAQCLYGFGHGYLLKSNGVLVSACIANIMIVLAIFIIHNTRLLNLIIPNPNKNKKVEEYDYDDEDYVEDNYDNYSDSEDYTEADYENYDECGYENSYENEAAYGDYEYEKDSYENAEVYSDDEEYTL